MSTPNPTSTTPFPMEDEASGERRALWNPESATPRWYDGMGASEDNAYLGPLFTALQGAGQGAAKGEELLGGLWHAQGAMLSGLPGIGKAYKAQQDVADTIMSDARDRVKTLTPDAATTGAATQIVHGLASGLSRIAIGSLAGGPAGAAGLMGGSEAVDRFQELKEQGVTPGAAAGSAAIAGSFGAAGALLPAGFGSSLIGKVLTGAAGQAGFGITSRYADHLLLEKAGYPEMAAQQKVWDATTIATDALLGGAFGAVAHAHESIGAGKAAEQPAPAQFGDLRRQYYESQVGRDVPGVEDAALTTNLAMRDKSSAPGVPVDPASANAHQAALEKGIQDILEGKPVDVSDTGVDQATFAQRPEEDRTNVQNLFLSALRDSGFAEHRADLERMETTLGLKMGGEPAGETNEPSSATKAPSGETGWQIPRAENLSGGDRDIETRFANSLSSDYEGMKAKYAALPDSAGGKILNTDTARELSPDYLNDRTKSAAVHEPASAFVKRLYAEKLAEAPGPGEDPVVLFTAGGTGAGKSSAVKNVLGGEAQRAQIVMDTNMNGEKSAVQKIDQALTAGKEVKVAYVHRDPVDALKNGALPRAMRQEKEFGSGRTVPIEEHVNTHVGANDVVRKVAAHYANDPRVSMRIIDNSRGAGGAKLIDLSELPRIDYNRTREEASSELEAAHTEDRISESVYRGFGGRDAAGARGQPGAAAAADGGEPGTASRGNAGDAAAAASAARPETGLGSAAGGQPEPQRAGQRSDELAPAAALKDYLTKGSDQINEYLRGGPAGPRISPEQPAYVHRMYADSDARNARTVAAIDKAFQTPERLAAPTTVERGLHWHQHLDESSRPVKRVPNPDPLATKFREGKLKPGEVIRDPAFMSTTDDHERAIGFATHGSEAVNLSDAANEPAVADHGDNVILRIDVPKDTPFVSGEAPGSTSGYGHEGERIFQRGSGIKVKSVTTETSPQGKTIHVVSADYVAPERAAKPSVDPLADPAHQAVQENPDLKMPDESGRIVNAADTLSAADKAVADAEREIPDAITAAINCFQRRAG